LSTLAVMQYVRSVLDGLPIPGDVTTGPLRAFNVPPDPDDNQDQQPTCVVWDGAGNEDRIAAPQHTLPLVNPDPVVVEQAAAQPGSGRKEQWHTVEVWVWLNMPDNASGEDEYEQYERQARAPQGAAPELEDVAFPAVVDAIMWRLRTTPSNVTLQDPLTGEYSQLSGLGENMRRQMSMPYDLAAQRWEKFMALITCSKVLEEFNA